MFVNLVLGRLKQQDHLFKISLAVNRDTHTRAKHREEVAAESSATNETSISPPPHPQGSGTRREQKREQKDGKSQRSGSTHRKREKKRKGRRMTRKANPPKS